MPRGVREMRARLAALADDLDAAIPAALVQEAQEIIAEGQERLAPVRNRGGGALRASGFVLPPERVRGRWRVVFGFGGGATKYAAAVHENPRAGKTGGVSPSGRRYSSWAEVGEWKFLSRPLYARAASLRERLALRVRSFLAARS